MKAITRIFNDLFVQYFSARKKPEIDFAFLLHARYTSDAIATFPFLRPLPEKITRMFLGFAWPIRLSTITGVRMIRGGRRIRGAIIAIPMTAAQMIEQKSRAKKKIFRAARFAEKLGAVVIGLGAYTSSLTDNGDDVKEVTDAAVTNGNTFTAIASAENISRIVSGAGKELGRMRIAILGATGSVGGILSRILLRAGAQELLLVSRTLINLEALKSTLAKQFPGRAIDISTDPASLVSADFVVLATNSPAALIQTEHLKKGAIVYDISQPKNITKSVISARRDCRFYEGGMVVSPPAIDYHFKFPLKQGNVFACLAETITIAAAEIPMEKITYGDDTYADLIKAHSRTIGFHPSYYEL
ncbi:hypothetical protein HYR65_01695 [Candidatus Azambacteria bacterium]|nr:hypothetical protein [Candidatus Azambacteria bacterium]